MDKMQVIGGGPLSGAVTVSGAKNSALPLIFSTLLAEGTHQLRNVPQLKDIDSAMNLMNSLGCQTKLTNNTLEVQVGQQLETLAHYDQVRKMRASILVLGPLLARCREATVSLPGGCAIGARPIGMHLDALQKMGATIEVDAGYVVAKTKGLQGATIDLPFATVGGTENIMMAASLAKGTTIINNAAREPEIVDLAGYLQSMGVNVTGAGTSRVLVEGAESLTPSRHSVIADRIEAGTLVIAGAITRGEVVIKECRPDHLISFLETVQAMGVNLWWDDTSITVKGYDQLRPQKVATEPFPGFPTDLQAQVMTLMTQVSGQSVMTEKVFENRFMHVSELLRMGAKIDIEGKTAIVHGQPGGLVGAPVMATDLRASASLILAGLVAKGETFVSRIYHLDRGYERLEDKLSSIGALIKRIEE
jgi:UDP-N-acetylglucosamine 1-carboxyvinyltransferase